MKKLGFIGTGNMASAMLRGAIASKLVEPASVVIYDCDTAKTAALSKELGVETAESARLAAESAEFVVCAVKPKDMAALLCDIADSVSKSKAVIISPAAGTELSKLASSLNEGTPTVRIMPNINAACGKAVTALCANGFVSDGQLAFAKEFCLSFGDCVPLAENLFSAFSAIAGCAPAFVYEFIDALAFAGVKNGLPRDLAQRVAAGTVLGSAQAVLSFGVHPAELRDRVCSPGGTTAEGVKALKELGFENSVITAVDRAAEKDRGMQK